MKEAWAVYEACKYFSMFILGAPTTLYCNHKLLANFLWNQTKNAMVNRWSLDIQEYALKFIWVDTHTNISDCLSQLVENDLYQEHDEIVISLRAAWARPDNTSTKRSSWKLRF